MHADNILWPNADIYHMNAIDGTEIKILLYSCLRVYTLSTMDSQEIKDLFRSHI